METRRAAGAYSDELHFPDGNLILQAGYSCFRVYGGFLAERSLVFRDMMSFPQPPDAETMDGASLVHLPDDPEDLLVFLKALFDYEFFEPFPAKTEFAVVASVLRLSNKYQVEPLYQRALVHFSSGFPTKLAEYLDPVARSWEIEDDAANIAAILLARDLGLDWILPVAFYSACADLAIAELLSGVGFRGQHLELGQADKQACLEGAFHMQGACYARMLDFLWTPPVIPGCVAAVQTLCMTTRIAARHSAEQWRDRGQYPLYPLTVWTEADWEEVANACAPCISSMKGAHQRELERFWDDLPSVFGLAEWSHLEAVREAALR